jgi:hypothetical protein
MRNHTTGWSIRKFVKTARPLPHRHDPGRHRRRPLPADLQTALDTIHDTH